MNLYLWNAKALADDLAAGKVTEKQKLQYWLVFTLLEVIFLYGPIFIGEPYTLWYTLDWLTVIVITIFGTLYCYRQNARGDDKDFIMRFVCLNLPIIMRLALLSLAVWILYFMLSFSFTSLGRIENPSLISKAMQVTITGILGATYYYLIGFYIARSARPTSVEQVR